MRQYHGRRCSPRAFGPALLLVALCAAPAWLAGAALAQPAAVVFTDLVREEPVAQTVPVVGRLVPREISVVAALINAPVFEVLVREGDRVERGQLLARLAPPRLAARVTLAEAELAEGHAELGVAVANLALSTQEFDRMNGLPSSSAFSQARYDEAAESLNRDASLVTVAEARVDALRAAVELAQIDLNNARYIRGATADKQASRI